MAATSRPRLRTCVGCRAARDQRELVRLHAGPQGQLLVDLDGGAGRGAYVCPARACLTEALRRGGLARTLRRDLRPVAADEILSALAAAVDRKGLALLGLARRAGQVAAGHEAVEARLASGAGAAGGLLVVARDAGATGSALEAAARRRGVAAVRFGSRSELGQALGRGATAVLLVEGPAFVRGFLGFLRRLPPDVAAGVG